jgi:hypothetical protein
LLKGFLKNLGWQFNNQSSPSKIPTNKTIILNCSNSKESHTFF